MQTAPHSQDSHGTLQPQVRWFSGKGEQDSGSNVDNFSEWSHEWLGWSSSLRHDGLQGISAGEYTVYTQQVNAKSWNESSHRFDGWVPSSNTHLPGSLCWMGRRCFWACFLIRATKLESQCRAPKETLWPKKWVFWNSKWGILFGGSAHQTPS